MRVRGEDLQPSKSLVRVPLEHSYALALDRTAGMENPSLLTSGQGFGSSSRWSILAADPRLIFRATDRTSELLGPNACRFPWFQDSGNPLERLENLLESLNLAQPSDAPDPALPPFLGGLIGFVGYDAAPLIETLPRRLPRNSTPPDVWFALYDAFLTYDHSNCHLDFWCVDLFGEGSRKLEERAREWLGRFEASKAPVRDGAGGFLAPLESEFDERSYQRAVERVLEYIRAGDVFQVNLARRLRANGSVDGFELYKRLAEISPAPFSAYIRGNGWEVASSSPEWFYQTRGRELITRPIKGTRPRGIDGEADDRLARELLASPKDRAELAMIIDLERNDLGRVCEYGTVRVSDPCTVESYPQVHHLVGTVQGRIDRKAGPIDVLRALFPGGSITGAPKIRAMQIIDEIEPCRRGIYTGAIGYWSRSGASGFNIAIRTFVVEVHEVSYHVGGAIVADSTPSSEYEETIHKGSGLVRSLFDLGVLR